jgi:hypothetical protein
MLSSTVALMGRTMGVIGCKEEQEGTMNGRTRERSVTPTLCVSAQRVTAHVQKGESTRESKTRKVTQKTRVCRAERRFALQESVFVTLAFANATAGRNRTNTD